MADVYKGYRELVLNNDEMSDFYSGLYEFPNDLKENEYILIKNNQDEIVDKVKYREGCYSHVRYPVINYNNKTIKARNEYQNCAIDLLLSRDIPVKLLLSPGGGGKDLLMSAAAMSLIEKGKFKKIAYIRPNVGVADVPDTGYLKGDLYNKLSWTLGPLMDKFGGQQAVDTLVKREVIELVPLMHIRGRSFEDTIVYVSEGQNLTTNLMKLIITRIGEHSELWINGDRAQTDRRVYEEDNGIDTMIKVLSGRPEFGQMYMPIIERSKVARLGALFDGINL